MRACPWVGARKVRGSPWWAWALSPSRASVAHENATAGASAGERQAQRMATRRRLVHCARLLPVPRPTRTGACKRGTAENAQCSGAEHTHTPQRPLPHRWSSVGIELSEGLQPMVSASLQHQEALAGERSSCQGHALLMGGGGRPAPFSFPLPLHARSAAALAPGLYGAYHWMGWWNRRARWLSIATKWSSLSECTPPQWEMYRPPW